VVYFEGENVRISDSGAENRLEVSHERAFVKKIVLYFMFESVK